MKASDCGVREALKMKDRKSGSRKRPKLLEYRRQDAHRTMHATSDLDARHDVPVFLGFCARLVLAVNVEPAWSW